MPLLQSSAGQYSRRHLLPAQQVASQNSLSKYLTSPSSSTPQNSPVQKTLHYVNQNEFGVPVRSQHREHKIEGMKFNNSTNIQNEEISTVTPYYKITKDDSVRKDKIRYVLFHPCLQYTHLHGPSSMPSQIRNIAFYRPPSALILAPAGL